MRLLVTGANGFIGGALVRLALSRGHEVAVVLRGLPARELSAARGGRLTVLEGSLEAPPWSGISDFRAEACLHAAWITTPGIYLEAEENRALCTTSREFLSRLPDYGLRSMVCLGTCIEYKNDGTVMIEAETPILPSTLYAQCKDRLRQEMELHAGMNGYRFCWARIFYPYGPGEHGSRLCSAAIAKLRRGEPILINTPRSIKDYIYIDDVASALLAVIEAQYLGAINICTGVGTSVGTMVESIGRMVGRNDLVRFGDAPQANDPLGFVVGSSARLQSLGWRPKTILADGLAKLLATV